MIICDFNEMKRSRSSNSVHVILEKLKTRVTFKIDFLQTKKKKNLNLSLKKNYFFKYFLIESITIIARVYFEEVSLIVSFN